MLCGEGVAVNADGYLGQAAPLLCKRWSCPTCSEINRWEVIKAAVRGLPTCMLTLTVDPKLHETPDDAARVMVRGLRALRKAMHRELEIEDPPMLVVFEKTKLGWPHMHILMRAPFIKQAWLSETWERLTGAPIVHIRAVTPDRGAAKYVSKYLGKDPHRFAGCKRWWRTHDYEVEPAPESDRPVFGRGWSRDEHLSWDQLLAKLDRAWVEIIEQRPRYVRWSEHGERPSRSHFKPRCASG